YTPFLEIHLRLIEPHISLAVAGLFCLLAMVAYFANNRSPNRGRRSIQINKLSAYLGSLTRWPLLLLSSLPDRKSTRLNSSHVSISYAVFCLKKKKITFYHPPCQP